MVRKDYILTYRTVIKLPYLTIILLYDFSEFMFIQR